MLTHFGVFRKQNQLLLSQKQLSLIHFGVFRKQKQLLLTHFGVFRKQNQLLLSQTPVRLLISVHRALMQKIRHVAKVTKVS
ncbi:hypothetical protein [Nostoc sp. UHCC 0252]|uniref:hypothetical protein n=1 Tax=Nostoc sp. UHCC 0252 TaxID=3110241 RepID=UPI002B1F86FC|nr:hypothetical protein [Nostoc sp. UHCC 0252]MEA5600002.1 hypothetical protein [Nostoc sp. UHCC 0252]